MQKIKSLICVISLATLVAACGKVDKDSPESQGEQSTEQGQQTAPIADVRDLNNKISNGLSELSRLNDPNISQVYDAINRIDANSTVNDLEGILVMIDSHANALNSGANAFDDGSSQSGMMQQAENQIGVKAKQIAGIQANIDAMKKMKHPEYEETSKMIESMDLQSMSSEELGQVFTITAKAIQGQ